MAPLHRVSVREIAANTDNAIAAIARFPSDRWPFVRTVMGLTTRLKHKNPEVPASVAAALGNVFADDAAGVVALLQDVVDCNSEWRVRRAASITIRKIERASQKFKQTPPRDF